MSPATMRNLAVNPFIEVNIVHPFLRRGYRFKGRADIVTEGETFDLSRTTSGSEKDANIR